MRSAKKGKGFANILFERNKFGLSCALLVQNYREYMIINISANEYLHLFLGGFNESEILAVLGDGNEDHFAKNK